MNHALSPVSGRARIDVLDMLRGLAILGILYMNIDFMGQAVYPTFADPRAIGWTVADRNWFAFREIFLSGTQRGMLELLFGAGVMVLTLRAMQPDGPVAVADLYTRRNLWLLLFGLADVFVLLWPGDILHIYALAALFLFPFRKLAAKWLLPLGLLFASFTAIGSGIEYASRSALVTRVEAADARRAQGVRATAADVAARAEWQRLIERRRANPAITKRIAEERQAHRGGFLPYAQMLWGAWFFLQGKGSTLFSVFEAFSVMLIGIAFWKWGIIQGRRSTRFYLAMMVGCYGFGLGARAVGVSEVFTFQPIPKTIWITGEFARIAVAAGHVALVNAAVRTVMGQRLLAPFRAAGRMAFSLYFMQQVVTLYVLFAPFGLNLWGRFGYAGLAAVATAIIAVQIVLANWWMTRFANGPMEWAWRSLAYWQWQPFRRRPGTIDEPLPGPGIAAA